MSNFENRARQPWTTYDNEIVQGGEVFKTPYQKLAFMFLYSYANAHKIFPSMDSIAVAIRATSRTAMNVIKELEEMTFIEVKRETGKSNNYILNDYFEVVERLTREGDSPVEKSYSENDKKKDFRTREGDSPVKEIHYTREGDSLLPVKEIHPITKTTKTKKEKEKLVSSSSGEFHSVDLIFLKTFTEIPFEEIKAKLLSDAANGKVKIKTEEQYMALMAKRIEFYIEAHPKGSETAQIEAKEENPNISLREAIKANMGESEKPESVPNDSEDDSESEKSSEQVSKEGSEGVSEGSESRETKKKMIDDLLKVVRAKKSPEEVEAAKKEIERLLQEIQIKSK